MSESILEEANRLVNGDRKDTYDGTDDTIVALWSAYLGVELTVLDYAAMMVLLKVARTKGKLHRDSWVDIAGYAEVGPRLWQAKQATQPVDWDATFGELTPEKAGQPREWDSLYTIPYAVKVRDRSGDIWTAPNGNWGFRVRGGGVWIPALVDVTNHDPCGPFTEVVDG